MANEYDDLLKKNFGPRSGTEYDQVVESQMGSGLAANVKRSMFVAQNQEPDRMAEAVKVSRDLKVDTQFAYQNLDPLKKKVEDEKFNYAEMSKEYPGLAAWFGKPENAAVGRDDLEPLKVIDKYGFSFKRRQRGGPESNIVSENIEAFESGWNNLGASAVMLGAAYGLLDPEEAAVNIAAFQSKSRALQERAPAYAKEFQEIMASQTEDIDEAINKVYGSWDQIKEGNILRGLMDFNAGVIETPAEVLDMLASWAIRPRGAIRAVSENLAYSLPALAAGQLAGIGGAKVGAAAGAPFGPAGAAAGAGIGGIAGFAGGSFLGGLPVEIGASLSEDLSKRGFDLTNAEDLVRALSDANLIKDIRGRAERKGLTTSAVDSLFALFAGRLVSKAGPQAGIVQRAGRAAADVGVEAVGEGAGEFAGQVAREGDLAKASLGEAVFEGLTSLGQSVGTVAAGASFRKALSPKTSEAAEQVLSEAEKAVRTVSQVEAIQKMGEAAKSSKVAERVPEKIEELVGDKASVYFQTDEWDAYFKTQNRSPIQAVQDILGEDGVRLYTEAKQTGVPLEIPLGRYMATAGRTQDFEALLSIIRVEPDGPKITEAAEALRSIPATMKELADEAETQRGFEESARVVRTQMEERLKAAGFQPEEARRQAELYESRARVRAELRGQAPEEVFSALNLQVSRSRFVEGPGPEVFEQPYQIDGTNIIDASDVFTGRQEPRQEERSEIDRFKARFGQNDTEVLKAIDRTQSAKKGPYVKNKKIPGIGFAPNFKSEPTGVLGEPKIQHSVRFGEVPDPFAWLDSKYGVTKRLLEEHAKRGIPLTIHTSSDLIGRQDYVEALPKNSVINIYFGPKDSSLEKLLFPANPSRLRLERAASVLEAEGFRVNRVQRSPEEIIQDAGGAKKVAEILGLEEPEVLDRIREDQSYTLNFFQEGDIGGGLETEGQQIERGVAGQRADVGPFQSEQETLEGLPKSSTGPSQRIRDIAEQYIASRGLSKPRQRKYLKADPERGKRIADAFQEMRHDPNNPDVRAAYQALIDETKEQFQLVKELGIQIEPITADMENPYPNGSNDLFEDVQGGHLWFFPTDLGFGTSEQLDHPLLQKTGEFVGDFELTANDMFRIVHDVFGHAKEGNGFGPNGEENAWAQHVQMYSDLAAKAMTTETRGQNSWVNFGPSGDQNRSDPQNTVYAEQKAGLLPDWVLSEGLTLFQEGPAEPRGQISIGRGYINISLLKNANLSTFLHETAHVFFNAEMADDVAYLQSLPELNERQQRFLDDVDGLLEFVGADSLENLTREQSEKLAKGFEVYLLEGKAPSNRLKRAFASFRTWLLNVYRRMRPNVQLTDEVRGIFDRLIATEEEINAVRRDEAKEPLLRDPIAAGMTSAQAERYARVAEQARENSIITLTNEIVSEEKKKQEKVYKQRRKEVMASVEAEVNNMRLYRALATLGKGTLPDGSPLPEGTLPIKIDKKTLEAAYGKEFLKRLPRPVIYSIKGGIHYDMAANMLGFESGDVMLQEMANAPSREAMIDRMTEERMKREYPELLESGAIEQAAVDAVHNDSQAELLKMDLQYLLDKHLSTVTNVVKRLTMRVPTDRQVRDQAERIIGDLEVSKIKPFLYERAERKAAKEAGEAFARGDFEAAFIAKRKELLNHELYRTARRALLDYKNTVQRFKKLSRSDEDLSKTRDMDLVNAARSLLAQFGIGRFRQDPESYLKNLKQYDADTYEAIRQIMDAALQNISNYRDLTYNDFSSLKDSVDALWSLSKSQREMEIDGQKIEREVAIAEMAARIDALRRSKKETKAYSQASSEFEKVKMGLLGLRAALRRVEFWVDAIDGGKINGVFRKYIFTPISEAADRYRIEKVNTIKSFQDLLEPIKDDLATNNKDIVSPELNHKFKGLAEVLGALLHTGNESNKSKLIRGWKWGAVDENGVLDSSRFDAFINRLMDEGVLQKRHFDFLQSVWDLFEKQKGEAQKAHKAMYGYYFSEITSNEFTNRFGTYRGGYVPAKVDPFKAMDAQIRKDKEEIEQFNNSFAFPTTGRGFTKSRVDKYAAPLTLNLQFIPAHLDWQLRFIHLEPKIKEVARIVNNRAFREKLGQVDPVIASEMLTPWLQRSARQIVSTPIEGHGGRLAGRFGRYLRSVSGMQIMMGNVVNAWQQFTGFSIAAIKVKPRYLRNALYEYVRAPKAMAEQVKEASAFMQTRSGNQIFDINKNIEDMILNPTKWDKVRDFSQKHSYFLQVATQNIVDTIVWTAAYNEATEKGLSEKESVRAANSVVRETQGSFNPEDVSRFETGNAGARLLTMFSSYFNMQANLLGTEFQIVANELGVKKGAGRLLYIYAFGLMIPAVVSDLIVRSMAGDFDEDDDDEYMDDLLALFFGSQARNAFAMVPGVGPIGTAAFNRFNDKWYDDRISTSPAVSLIEGAVGAPAAAYRILTSDELKKKDVRDVFTLLGLMSGVPVLPFSRPISYLIDVESGDAEPTGPIDFTRGLITGRPGNQ